MQCRTQWRLRFSPLQTKTVDYPAFPSLGTPVLITPNKVIAIVPCSIPLNEYKAPQQFFMREAKAENPALDPGSARPALSKPCQ